MARQTLAFSFVVLLAVGISSAGCSTPPTPTPAHVAVRTATAKAPNAEPPKKDKPVTEWTDQALIENRKLVIVLYDKMEAVINSYKDATYIKGGGLYRKEDTEGLEEELDNLSALIGRIETEIRDRNLVIPSR